MGISLKLSNRTAKGNLQATGGAPCILCLSSSSRVCVIISLADFAIDNTSKIKKIDNPTKPVCSTTTTVLHSCMPGTNLVPEKKRGDLDGKLLPFREGAWKNP